MAQKRRREKRVKAPLSPAPYAPSLWDDIKVFGTPAIVCLTLLAIYAPISYAIVSSASEMRRDLRSLPFAHGQPAGARAVLSGTIAQDTKPLFHSFVAYAKEVYSPGGGRGGVGSWEETGGMRQRLRLHGGGREGWIENTSYRFSPSIKWWSDPILPAWYHDERSGETAEASDDTVRYRGFVAGRAVAAVGTVTPGGFLDAEYVVAGTREEVDKMLGEIASGAGNRVAYWFTLVSAAGLAVSIFFFVRARRRAARALRG